MGIDDIEASLASQPQAAPKPHWRVREHRRHVGHCELAPEKHGNSHNLHVAVGGCRRKAGCTRGEHRHVMTAREVTSHGCHDYATAAAQRWIFEIAKQDAHEWAAIA